MTTAVTNPSSELNSSGTKRRKWIRKAPLISKGGGMNFDPTIDPGSMKNSNMILLNRKQATSSLKCLKQQFVQFLTHVTDRKWAENETHRRFYIFGDYITCARWKNGFLVSSPDVFKIQSALFRLEKGCAPPSKKRFEEVIVGHLRGIVRETELRIEESNSPMIKFLYSVGAIRTRKRQKVFFWDAINHLKLYESRVKNMQEKVPESPRSVKKESPFVITSLKIYTGDSGSDLDDLVKAAEVMDQLESS